MYPKDEQRRRLFARLNEPEKHWKFSPQDLKERKPWKRYMAAYESTVNATSRSWAPWYVIPADDKPFMRMCVAEIITHTLKCFRLRYPTVSRAKRQAFVKFRKQLQR